VTEEVNRVFETNIDPEAIRYHARKVAGGGNLPPKTTPCNDTEKEGVHGGAEIA